MRTIRLQQYRLRPSASSASLNGREKTSKVSAFRSSTDRDLSHTLRCNLPAGETCSCPTCYRWPCHRRSSALEWSFELCVQREKMSKNAIGPTHCLLCSWEIFKSRHATRSSAIWQRRGKDMPIVHCAKYAVHIVLFLSIQRASLLFKLFASR